MQHTRDYMNIHTLHKRMQKAEHQLLARLQASIHQNVKAYCDTYDMSTEEFKEKVNEDPSFMETFIYNAVESTPKSLVPTTFLNYKG